MKNKPPTQSLFISLLKPGSDKYLEINYYHKKLIMHRINITEAYILEMDLKRNEDDARCWESAFEIIEDTLIRYPEAGVVLIERKLAAKSDWIVSET